MGATKELAKFVAKASWPDFPEKTVEVTKGLLFKTVTGMVVGSREPVGKLITQYFAAMGGNHEAGIVGAGFRTSTENAAMAHGIFAHASELEDDEFPNVIGDFWVLPTVFAVGEKVLASGREIIEAAIVGWEITGKLNSSGPAWWLAENCGISTSNWLGCIGAAAAAAKLLKLNPLEVENALSIAASHACGNIAAIGWGSHYIETGVITRGGVLAATLAKMGATGRPDIFENKQGLFGPIWKFDPEFDFKAMGNPGKPHFDVHNVWVKKWPCCFGTHPALDAMYSIVRENEINLADIESVELEVDSWTRDLCDRQIETLDSLRFSLQYQMAEVLVRKKCDLSSFTEVERLTDPTIADLMKKVKIIVPEGWTRFLDNGTRVTVIKKEGEKIIKYVRRPLGSPEDPLTLEQISEVCMENLNFILAPNQQNRVTGIMLNLEKQIDIRELMSLLTFFREVR